MCSFLLLIISRVFLLPAPCYPLAAPCLNLKISICNYIDLYGAGVTAGWEVTALR